MDTRTYFSGNWMEGSTSTETWNEAILSSDPFPTLDTPGEPNVTRAELTAEGSRMPRGWVRIQRTL